MKPLDLSIIVFAYNEEESVAHMLGELLEFMTKQQLSFEIVFVDDGSTDKTLNTARTTLAKATLAGATAAETPSDAGAARSAAEATHQVVAHPRNRGIGASLKTGVRLARGAWVTFVPADGQIPPEALMELWHTRLQTGAELVLSRYRNRDDGVHRWVLSQGVRSAIFLTQGTTLDSDGPYLFRRELFDPSQLIYDSFFLNFEFPLRAKAAGLRIAHCSIDCRKRVRGHSKSSNLRTIRVIARDLIDFRLRRSFASWFTKQS